MVTVPNSHQAAKQLGLKKSKVLSSRTLLYQGSQARASAIPGAHVEGNNLVTAAVAPEEVGTDNKELYWYHDNRWSGTGDINSPLAWNYALGEGVVVAVVDSGVDAGNPELDGQMWTNAHDPLDGRDNDSNGIIDDVNGARFDEGTAAGDSLDQFGHGTRVAGLVAAKANNGGLVGVSPSAKIMSVRILSDRGTGRESDLIAGIDYAVRNGADIVNLSLEMKGADAAPGLQAAVDEAARRGVLVVVAAGNFSRDIDTAPIYPASLAGDNILTVGASDSQDNRADMSNFGSQGVDLFAPGEHIATTSGRGLIAFKSGTSLATPMVSGTAALLLSYDRSLTATQLRKTIIASADRSAGLVGLAASGGRLDTGRALEKVSKLRVVKINTPNLDGASLRLRHNRVRIKMRMNSPAARHRVYLDGRTIMTLRGKAGETVSRWVRSSRGVHLLEVVTSRGDLRQVSITRSFTAR